jgi:hypothetical protein
LTERVRQTIRGVTGEVTPVARVGGLTVFHAETQRKRLGGLMRSTVSQYRVIDPEGIIRLQIRQGDCLPGTKSEVIGGMKEFFDKHTIYGDAGREFPDLFVIFRGRILDMSGLMNIDQINSLIQVELSTVGNDEPIAAILKTY